MTMQTKTTRTQSIDEVIELDDVKRALGILDDEDDEEIQDLIYVAVGLAERYCHRTFSTTTVNLERDDSELTFTLPYGENVVIDSVTLDGDEYTDYSYSAVTDKFKVGQSYSTLEITYSCGFTELPKPIDRAVKYLVSTMFNSGQDFTNTDVNEIPLRSTVFLDTEKRYVI